VLGARREEEDRWEAAARRVGELEAAAWRGARGGAGRGKAATAVAATATATVTEVAGGAEVLAG